MHVRLVKDSLIGLVSNGLGCLVVVLVIAICLAWVLVVQIRTLATDPDMVRLVLLARQVLAKVLLILLVLIV